MIPKTLFITFSLLLISLTPATAGLQIVEDFYVADLNLPKEPAGYPCRDPAKVTANDFTRAFYGVPVNTTRSFKYTRVFLVDNNFPALNGLGISVAQAVIQPGGAFPLNLHNVPEIIIIVAGCIIAGFISSDNTPYYKTLNKGEVMVIPQGLPHFQINIGSIPALLYGFFTSANPTTVFISSSIFGSGLPINIITAITKVNSKEAQRLQGIFCGECNN